MSQKNTPILEVLLIGLSSIALCIYLYVALSRIAYPFTIEWVEANTFLHIVRVLEHKPIFVPPSHDFIPMIYTPLYYYTVALFAKIIGKIMFSMRLVSILASLLVFAAIYALGRLREITPQFSIIAVGLFAASYAVTGYWFDVGRVDTLFLALLLVGYVLTIAQTKREGLIGAIAGFVIFLSFATKQSALLSIPFLLFYLFLKQRWGKALWLGASFVISYGLFIATTNIVSNGWSWIYTYKIPSAHPLSWEIITRDFWTLYIFPKFPWLVIVIILAAIVLLMVRDKETIFNYLAFVCAFLLPLSMMSIGSMAKQWGYVNGLLPMLAALSIAGAEAYQQVASAVTIGLTRTQVFKALYYLASMVMVLQFGALLLHDFRTQIPKSASLDAGYKILDILENSKRPIFVPTSPYLLYMVRQQTHFHAASLGDLYLAAQHDPTIKQVYEEYLDRIEEYRASGSIKTAILPNGKLYSKAFSAENGYDCKSLVADSPPLTTVTGAISYLDRICCFCEESSR